MSSLVDNSTFISVFSTVKDSATEIGDDCSKGNYQTISFPVISKYILTQGFHPHCKKIQT